MQKFEIRIAETQEDFNNARALFEEYAATLDFDLSYQQFDKELDQLSTQYSSPDGALILSYVEIQNNQTGRESASAVAAGCAGVRRFAEGVAELKRLYVQPEFRKLKMGRSLLEAALAAASRLGYEFLRLDTVPGQEKAQDLYRSLGFYEIEPYRYSAIANTLYFEKKLAGP